MMEVYDSAYGRALHTQLRYARYSPPDELIDADLNNLQHLAFTALLGQFACYADGLSPADTDRVVRDLLVHDVAEAQFSADDHGDITYDLAQASGSHKQEHRRLEEILQSPVFASLSDRQAHEIVTDMDDAKLPQPQTVYGQHIELAERFGYLHSGTRAAIYARELLATKVSIDPNLSSEVTNALWMGENCLGNNLPRLLGLSKLFPSAKRFLSSRETPISWSLSTIYGYHDHIWDGYRREGLGEAHVDERKQKLEVAIQGWVRGHPYAVSGVHNGKQKIFMPELPLSDGSIIASA